jgi:glycosyltransferase involved in cell wall biosynthesis
MAYHKSPPVLSSVYDARAMRRRAAALAGREKFDIIHCRGYLPALAGLAVRKRHGGRFLFDMRGFWPDERVDGKTWNLRNPVYYAVYNYFKRKEALLLREADHIVSLTHAGRDVILGWQPGRPVDVIPCCCDTELFSPDRIDPAQQAAWRSRLGLPEGAPVLCYLGALGTFYMLDEMLAFFRELKREYPGARFLFITLHDPQWIRERAAAAGLQPGDIVVTAAARAEVPVLLSLSFLSVFFIVPQFSKKASSPTKLAEALAMGLPVVCNEGVGDTPAIVRDNRCGAVVEAFTDEAYRQAVETVRRSAFDPESIRAAAVRHFSLALGVARYDAIYKKLAGGTDGA